MVRRKRVDQAAVAQVRRFNRFYTRRLRLLERGHLGSSLTLSEVRVLYELAHREAPTARELEAALRLDPGYLSRMLRRLREVGLVRATTGTEDRREKMLELTARGTRLFADLDRRAARQVSDLLRDLDPSERPELLAAMTTIERVLSESPAEPEGDAAVVELRDPLPGDLGWVVQRHGELYAQEYKWDESFERLVAKIVGDFAAQEDSTLQQCWIATLNGRRAGCVFLTQHSPGVGQLRLLLVEPWARGHGLGERLVNACLDGARRAGYRRIYLWTNNVLHAARRLYQRAGFSLTSSERGRKFGHDLVSQTWERDL